MAKRAHSPRSSAAKPSKTTGRTARKSTRSAKPATGRSTGAKGGKSGRSTSAARAVKNSATTASRSAKSGKPAGTKTAKRRTSSKRRGSTVGGYVATLDGWCKQCTARVRTLLEERSARMSRAAKRSARTGKTSVKRHAASDWLTSGARQVGLGLRRGVELANPQKLLAGTGKKIRHIKFNRVSKFCKKEWTELAALASKLNELANHPPRHRAKRARK